MTYEFTLYRKRKVNSVSLIVDKWYLDIDITNAKTVCSRDYKGRIEVKSQIYACELSEEKLEKTDTDIDKGGYDYILGSIWSFR